MQTPATSSTHGAGEMRVILPRALMAPSLTLSIVVSVVEGGRQVGRAQKQSVCFAQGRDVLAAVDHQQICYLA